MRQHTKLEVNHSKDSVPLQDDSSDANEMDENDANQQQLEIAPSYMNTSQTVSNTNPSIPQQLEQETKTNIINDSKPSYLKLITNELFYSRIIILLITIFLFILSLGYTLGQILSLQLSEFWCPKRRIAEVLAHSKEIHSNVGDNSGCWTTKLFTINKEALWTTESYTSKWALKSNAFKCTGFLIISLVLLSLIIAYIYRLIIDIKLYRQRKLGKKRQHKQLLRTQHTIHNTTQSSTYFDNLWCTLFIYKIRNSYNRFFKQDSGFWCIKKLCIEIFEIFVQSSALLYYNGYGLFSTEDVILAYKPQYIMLFTIFLSMNCIFSGLIWLFYVFRPVLCHGFVFELLLYSMDVIFDIFYTLFPLIVVLQANPKIFVALGSLQTDDQITFWAAFIPLTFLCLSSYSFSHQARVAMEEYYGTKFLSSHLSMRRIKNTDNNTSNNQQQIEMSNISSRLPSKIIDSKSWVISSDTKKNQITRKILMVIIAFLFPIYGIIVLSLVISHFDRAIPYCSSVVDELNNLDIVDELYLNSTMNNDAMLLSPETQHILDKHPELFLFNFCEFAVYPFGTEADGDPICECRQFSGDKFRENEHFIWSVPELDYYFNITVIDMLSNMLSKWRMLEKFRWQHTKDLYRKSTDNKVYEPPLFNLTSDMFGAHKMRAFVLTDTPCSYIDAAISNWRLLAYFDWTRNGVDDLFVLPDTIGELQDLGYFELSDLPKFTVFPEQLCLISSLRTIDFEFTGITSIPHCIDKLYNLQSLIVSGTPFMKSVPLNIFNHPSLVELSGIQSRISIESMIQYNNLSDFNEFDAKFEYNKDINYWFEQTSFCVSFFNGDIPSNSTFYQFIVDTDCCKTACDATSYFAGVHCKSYELQNGFCDIECNNPRCDFDGGDCVQLCECDEINELGNDICDTHCNTTDCLWDGYDCLPLGYDPIVCELSYDEHKCNISWLGDGWCDSNCLNTDKCGNDLTDCIEGCASHTQCSTLYSIVDVIANSNTNDNHIDEIELKNYWNLGLQLGVLDPSKFTNYTQPIPAGDLNDDGLLNLHELVILVHDVYGVSLDQAQQIDCSACVGYQDFYN